ncbi:MAG: chromosome partitioning protein ParB [Phenylobacterium zucineum]|nr:MAG: chromosome partitioning protein ParB [Phenylobacterium zucineum]
MRLAFADPRNMTLSPLNMHYGRPDPDVSDIAPSIRKRGVLLTLLVLETLQDGVVVEGHFEVVAGRRRWTAALAAVTEGIELDPIPVGILEPGDDVGALEASLIENLGRLPPDEVTCWETFSRLVKGGRSPEQIAATFGLADVVVKRTLALGGLLPRIRNLYRKEEIDVATVRQLTLATKAQQKAWLALLDDPEQRAPTGSQLRSWLFGGASIPTKNALFPLDDYPGQIVADLFGEESYFADPDLFWACQNPAIAARAEALQAAGWAEVQVLDIGDRFPSWTHEQVGKRAGGRVYVEVGARGEVAVYEGWLTAKEARKVRAAAARGAAGEAGEAPPAAARPEATSAQAAYIDLHRLAAVRVALTENPGVALRLLVAHAICGSGLWRVEAEPRQGLERSLAESLEANTATGLFAERRRAAVERVGLDAERGGLVGQRPEGGTSAVFARLLGLGDAEVLGLAAVAMAETVAAGSAEAEAAGLWLKADVARFWSPDAAFFELIRDREIVNAMLREVGGKKAADGNLAAKVRTQAGIIQDFLAGSNDRPRVASWTPRWMGFPATAYTKRAFAPAQRSRTAGALLRRVKPSAEAPEVMAAA